VVFALDFAKGAIAALVGLALAGHAGAYVLGAAAIVGHALPVTRRFKGGRGVATGAGVVFVVFPLVTVGAAVVWFLVVWLTHKASVASLTVIVLFPIVVALTGSSVTDVVVLACLAVLVIARHLSNLRRLLRGEELGLDPGSDAGAAS
jgi:glycerol-3-phosphate acyltransferase PlsY